MYKKKREEGFTKSNKLGTNPTLSKIDEFTIQLPDSLTAGNYKEMFESTSDNTRFAFYDRITKRFVITNSKGEVLSVLGGKGRGPKELLQVSCYNFDEQGNLVVYDNQLLRLKVYSPQGQILKNVALEGERKNHFIDSFQLFASDGKIYFGIMEAEYVSRTKKTDWWKSKLFAVYNYSGELLEKIGSYDPSVLNIYGRTPQFYLDSSVGELFSAHAFSYRIKKWDTKSGKRLAYFGYKPKKFTEYNQEDIDGPMSQKKRNEMYTKQSALYHLYVDNENIYLPYQNVPKEFFATKDNTTKEYNIAIYKRESHRYSGTITLPGPLAHIQSGKIYIVENTNPENYQIGVYEVK